YVLYLQARLVFPGKFAKRHRYSIDSFHQPEAPGKGVPVKCIINNQIVLLRAPEGPLAPHVGPFARFLSEQGYTLNSIQRQVLLAACFSRWLKQQGVALRNITSDHAPRYLRYRARQVRPSLGDSAALRHLLDFLRWEGAIPVEKISVCPL